MKVENFYVVCFDYFCSTIDSEHRYINIYYRIFMKILFSCLLLVVSPIALSECNAGSFFPLQRFSVAQNGMFPGIARQDVIVAISGFAFSSKSLVHGDIVLFCAPYKQSAEEYTLIWRVVGLPGDNIRLDGDEIYLNGVHVVRNFLEYKDGVKIYEEQLGSMTYQVAFTDSESDAVDVEYSVPDGHLFLLGDNRHDAYDGRYMGFIPFDKVFARKVR